TSRRCAPARKGLPWGQRQCGPPGGPHPPAGARNPYLRGGTVSQPKVLLVGYNGANNTGSEALLTSDIADVRAVLGPDVPITVPTLNPANLRRYVKEGPALRIAP